MKTKILQISIIMLLSIILLGPIVVQGQNTISSPNIANNSGSHTFANQHAWHEYISHQPTPGSGCFIAKYPNPVWQRTACAPPTSHHILFSTPMYVGAGPGFVAESLGTNIGFASGTFPSVSGLTSETDVCAGPLQNQCNSEGGATGANDYSLQMNTNVFPVIINGRSINGWEQFIFSTKEGVLIQYWLFGVGSSCPSGWTQSGNDCSFDSDKTSVPSQPPTSLSQLSFEGKANLGGNDVAELCVAGESPCYATSSANLLNLSDNWKVAEFNVFGDGGFSQAQFNIGTTILVENDLLDQNQNPITPVSPCSNKTQTAETNNLNTLNCTVSSSGISFTESNDFSVECGPLLGGSFDSSAQTCTLMKTTTINKTVVIDIPNGQTLIIPSGVILNNNGSINNHGTISINQGGVFNNNYQGNFNNYGPGTVYNNGGIFNNNPGSFLNNNGGGSIDNGGNITNFGDGTFNNNLGSFLNNNADGLISNSGAITNTGNIHSYYGSQVANDGNITNLDGGAINNSGNITNQADGTITNSNINNPFNVPTIIVNSAEGQIDNSGSIINYEFFSNLGVIVNLCGGTIIGNPIAGIQPQDGCNTRSGSNVNVNPATGVSVTFSTVTADGETTATTTTTNPTGQYVTGFQFLGTYYDIATTASYTPPVTVCLSYDPTGMTLIEQNALQIFHFDTTISKWLGVTTSLDTTNHVICGQVNALSPFTIGFPTLAYVSNSGSNNVSVINTTSNTILANVNVGIGPTGLVLIPSGTRLYVTNTGENDVSVVNTTTNTVISTVGVGIAPTGVAADSAGTEVFVTNTGSNNVSVINTTTNTVISTVGVGIAPTGVAVNPTGTRLYVADSGNRKVPGPVVGNKKVADAGNKVSVINTTTNTVIANVTVGIAPSGVAINPMGTMVYVANTGSGTVSVIDTATNNVTANVTVGTGPTGVAVNLTGALLYVANSISGTVSVIDTTTNKVIATVSVGIGPIGVAISQSGSQVIVTNSGSRNVSVIDTTTNKVIATIAVGNIPSGVAII